MEPGVEGRADGEAVVHPQEEEIKVHWRKENQIYKPFNLEFSLKIIQKGVKKVKREPQSD